MMIQPTIQPDTTAKRSPIIRPRDTFTAEVEIVTIMRELHQLRRSPTEGNGHDVAVPNTNAIERAIAWIKDMHNDALWVGGEWLKPHIATDEDGDVAFEWWKGDRKLTVYVSPEATEYIKVERPAVTSDLTDGTIETPEDRRELWRWLTG